MDKDPTVNCSSVKSVKMMGTGLEVGSIISNWHSGDYEGVAKGGHNLLLLQLFDPGPEFGIAKQILMNGYMLSKVH